MSCFRQLMKFTIIYADTIYLTLSVYLCVYLCVFVSVCVCLSVCPYIHTSIKQSIYLTISTYMLHICPSVHPSIIFPSHTPFTVLFPLDYMYVQSVRICLALITITY